MPKDLPDAATLAPQRARGALELSVKARDQATALDKFRTTGCMKALFPRQRDRLEAILINTAGGVTGGDRLSAKAVAKPGTRLTLTTQSAERAYRANSDWGVVENRLDLEPDADVHWLPQELIVFEGARVRRKLTVNLAYGSRLLAVEPVVFGRTAMGETLHDVCVHDRIEVWRDGHPMFADAMRFEGDVQAQLASTATCSGASAMATVLYLAPDAQACLPPVRAGLPDTAGATVLADDLLAIRMVAEDGFHLRHYLLPILDRLSRDNLPTSWRL